MTPSSPPAATGPRLGPRPLPLHLTAAAMSYGSSNAALPLLRSGLLRWSPALQSAAADLQEALANVSPDALAIAVEAEGRRRLDGFLTGIERYRHHPYRRDTEYPSAVWREGSTRLYDYGEGGGVPVLLVPSLINRAYILDLSSRHSFARWLAQNGLWPFLVDWDAPGDAERRFDLTDYITRRLEPAMDAVGALSGARPAVLGYCMGGLLALALAQRRQGSLRGMALLATPWDFHAGRAAEAMAMGAVGSALEGLMAVLGDLPVDLIQTLFASLDPVLAERKFAVFSKLDSASDRARDFVALEDWVNDGVPLAAPVARECLKGWYGENAPVHGRWRIADRTIDPGVIDLPTLVVVPASDRIVPPESALPLGDALRRSDLLRPDAGHIGMIASHGVEASLWPGIADWLVALP